MAPHSIEHRVTSLETQVDEMRDAYDKTFYRLHRDRVENRLGMRLIIQHLNLAPVTTEDVDEALDQE